MESKPSNRLRTLLKKARRLLLNRYFWYLLMLILRVLKQLGDLRDQNE